MFGLKWSLIGYFALALLIVGAGSAGAGYYQGVKHQKVVYERSVMSEFFKRVDTAMEIADDFIKIGQELAIKVREIRSQTNDTVTRGTTYVASKPAAEIITPALDLDPYLIELRKCQIDEIWRDLGADLPRDRVRATCPPALPEGHKGDPHPGRG